MTGENTTIRIGINSPMFGFYDQAIDIPFEGEPAIEYLEIIKDNLDTLGCMAKQWMKKKLIPEDRISPIDEVIMQIKGAGRKKK